jgi:TatD DNase family protein
MPVTLIDSHVHLDSPDFQDDLDAVVARALAADVRQMVTIGCLGPSPEVPDRLLRILDRYPSVWATAGVHPHDARLFDDALEQRLAALLGHPRFVALGEIGLDFHYDFSPRDAQFEAFRRQLALAARLGKPVVIHTREAEEETAAVLAEFFPEGSADSGILHCFPGGDRLQETGLSRGFCFGFGGVLTFKKAEAVRRSLLALPSDRIVLETDAPYLAPVPHRGKRNESAFVPLIAREAARLRGVPWERFAEETSANCRRLFPGLACGPDKGPAG